MGRLGTQDAAEELQLLAQHDPEISGELRIARAAVVERLRGEGGGALPPTAGPVPAATAAAAIRIHAPEPTTPAPPKSTRTRLEALLRKLVSLGGSDLHLKAGLAPYLRREGRLIPLKEPPPDREELLDCMRGACSPEQMERFMRLGDLDLALGLAGVARFRLNFMMARGQPSLVARVIPTEVPGMAALGLPQSLHDLALSPKGLLLVTGPTGSGKSTTLAAMLDLINSVRRGHIITIEDPIEFIHRDKLSSVTQREVGVDVASFADGVRFALRQDPDVLLVGELRDLLTVRAAFQAAGAGRLVLGTLHTNSAAKTIERLVNIFPPEEQPQARMSLSLTLSGVVSQTLAAKAGGGRVAIHEILVATGAVRKAIREKQTQAIYGLMESGAAAGMTTLEQGLARLVRSQAVTKEEALALANEPALLGMF
ncbi:MAG: PilT/PilU family type 4a pilus ATPase [Candidatus Wallbacteria bacterium]|nr:PilT/PilU family type 4a pilus ATPase [Candidatus Wallbacteria bacterium]